MSVTINLEVQDVIKLMIDGPISEGKAKIVRQLANQLSMDSIRNEILIFFKGEELSFEDIVKSFPEQFVKINYYFGNLLWDFKWKELLS